MRIRIALLLTGLLLSCSFNYEEAMWEPSTREYPNMTIEHLSHRVVQDGALLLSVTAEKAEEYRDAQILAVTGVLFQEFDREGNVVRQGRAAHARFHRDTEDIETEGEVEVQDRTEDITIRGSDFTWKKKERSISAPPGVEVEIQGENYRLRGTGFSADAGTLSLRFTGNPQGTYTQEEDGE
ncbi:LPS export ABC transporter periplasmic protein LptC [Spirochaeta thermophila]|uniref:LPS export ABC transporter periplasmic protein LptC n=1 Tax=Winmispira thermophila (strain ATCC 49972 / DSM 6192 / RI 19.B1) TaxID=665571 RepID=E0RRL5_WINT6|nr:LPS export ABC transporter periplasmic protein LptC [Spirochaeta thermophila]ADN03119.1 hypothetical protein STHERM_c21910 [Spirochaeta thermophila DSM 6192]